MLFFGELYNFSVINEFFELLTRERVGPTNDVNRSPSSVVFRFFVLSRLQSVGFGASMAQKDCRDSNESLGLEFSALRQLKN